jgi:hypothetical protein
MKVKELFYIETTNFAYLNDVIADMLRKGWEPYGHIVVNGPFYLQGMVKREEVKAIEMAVGNNEECSDKVNAALKEGAKLCGAPFAVGNYLCQGLVRID